MSLLTKLNPYMLYLKIAFVVAMFLSGVFVGCKADSPDCSVPEKARAELIVENAALRKANADYADAEKLRSEQAAANKAAQEALAREAQVEANAARKRAQTLQSQLDAIEARQAEAARDPKCRDIMELEVCPALRRK